MFEFTVDDKRITIERTREGIVVVIEDDDSKITLRLSKLDAGMLGNALLDLGE